MGEKHREIRLKVLQGELGNLAYKLTHLQMTQPAHGWQPAINVYRCDRCLKICVDLAGVEKSKIDLKVEHGRLRLRGERALPEPTGSERPCRQILAMEIDHGPFEREIALPRGVGIAHVTAQQRQGFLWITLPLETGEGA